jgi:uncharacterized membrane protein
MNTRLVAAALTAAMGIAMVMPTDGFAAGGGSIDQKKVQENLARKERDHLEQCFGIASNGRNDCASSSHACAGQQTVDRDPDSFVLVAEGTCGSFSGGALQAMHK